MSTETIEAIQIRPEQLFGLKVDPAAQRALNLTKVREIVKGFNAGKLGVITLSQRDGEVWIIDGQTRVSALKLLKYDKPVHATLSKDLTLKQEAERFLGLNDSKPVTPVQAFPVRVTAEHPVEVGVKRVLDGFGLEVGKGGVNAVRSLGNAFRILGADDMARLVSIPYKAWCGQPRFMQASILDALRRIIAKHNSVDEKRMADVLSTHTPSTLIGMARQRANLDGGTTADAMVTTFINLYNKGLRSGKLETGLAA